MEGEPAMNENYGTYNATERKYGKHIFATQYEPRCAHTDVGSGSRISAELVAAAGMDPWSVSNFGERVQRVRIKAADYGGWKVDVLDRPDPTPTVDHVRTTKEKLNHIRDIFGLSISHLAGALLTSRPSLHAWLDGNVEPRDQSIERIMQIHQIAQMWKRQSAFHYSPDRLMRQPLGSGPSMLERLEKANLDDVEIQDGLEKLLQLMRRQRIQMDQAKQRSSSTSLSEREQERIRHSLTTTVTSR
jgi:hypothetical protein